MSTVHVGAVLRVTRAVQHIDQDNKLSGPVGWAVVIKIGEFGHPEIAWITDKRLSGRVNHLNRRRGCDEFTVCPAKDVPDEVLAELTRMQLLGEVTL